MTPRKALSPMRRLAVFERDSGVCYLCSLKIQVGQKWDVEHVIPLALGGADDPANMRPAHKACHAPKTADDVGRIAKAKRVKAKMLGIKGRSRFAKPPEGSHYDWKRRRYTLQKDPQP